MKYKILAALLLFTFAAQAQNTIRPNIYFQNMHYYNPAEGINDSDDKYEVSLYGKNKFVDNDEALWDKPMNIWLNHIGRINEKSSYSAAFITDKYSFYNRNSVYAGYIRRLLGNDERNLSIGARAVFNLDKVNWDEAPQAGKSGSQSFFKPDFDLGIQYKGKRITVGLSSKNLLGSKAEVDEDILLKNQQEWYLNASYFLFLRENFKFAPYVLFYKEGKRDIDFDAGLFFGFKDRVNISYALRLFELRSIYMLELKVLEGLYLGASFDSSPAFTDNNLDFQIKYRF